MVAGSEKMKKAKLGHKQFKKGQVKVTIFFEKLLTELEQIS